MRNLGTTELLLDFRKLVILKFQLIPHVHAEGQQGDGYLRDHAGVLVFHERVVAPNVNDGTEHKNPLFVNGKWKMENYGFENGHDSVVPEMLI